MLITKEFKFDSAHFLTKYHGKCEKMHGHTYKMHVTIEGEVKDDGMVYDFVELKKLVRNKVISKLDHAILNDIIENPSAENICMWVWDQLEKEIEGADLYEVKVWETATSFATYRGK